MAKRVSLKEYYAMQSSADGWQPVKKVCLDGKVRSFRPMGYDCIHFGYGIGDSIKCSAFPDDPKHGCPAMNCPWRCRHFKIRNS